MIPKTIHYCWLGGAPKPKSVLKCIDSWRRHCPDYEIIEWNEKNFSISACPSYVRDAYQNKKWAFATDYIRLKVIYEHGGVYFDTDVELVKNIDLLLSYNAFLGFEHDAYVNSGLGFGAERGAKILKEMMDAYNSLSFILPDGSLNQVTCPIINTKVLLQHGLIQNNKTQIIDENILILSSIYMCPLNYETGTLKKTRKTISIHWFHASWLSKDDQEYHKRHRQKLRADKFDYWIHLPNRFLMKMLGDDRYKKFKKRMKK